MNRHVYLFGPSRSVFLRTPSHSTSCSPLTLVASRKHDLKRKATPASRNHPSRALMSSQDPPPPRNMASWSVPTGGPEPREASIESLSWADPSSLRQQILGLRSSDLPPSSYPSAGNRESCAPFVP
ncbi:hypothetical protein LIA77_09375 [Sarocladium implicatum]|nr:hypothetical protein LIA77_09375 [Sarocladium implicatum]